MKTAHVSNAAYDSNWVYERVSWNCTIYLLPFLAWVCLSISFPGLRFPGPGAVLTLWKHCCLILTTPFYEGSPNYSGKGKEWSQEAWSRPHNWIADKLARAFNSKVPLQYYTGLHFRILNFFYKGTVLRSTILYTLTKYSTGHLCVSIYSSPSLYRKITGESKKLRKK